MLFVPFCSCQRYQIRSIMQWCAQKIGSKADVATTPISPPTHTCIPSWMSSSCEEKSTKLPKPIKLATSDGFGKELGRSGERCVWRAGPVGISGIGPEARAFGEPLTFEAAKDCGTPIL